MPAVSGLNAGDCSDHSRCVALSTNVTLTMRAMGASCVHEMDFVHGTVTFAVNVAVETCIESVLSASTDESSGAEKKSGCMCFVG